MKIAVYTIALNEQAFVERWYKSAKEADYLLIADTGSTDLTVKYAKNLGINVIQIAVRPWRFDDARNAALAALPLDVDYCVALDMDEELQPGWRQELEFLDPQVTRPRYKYTWSWNPDGSPSLVYGGDKIHSRRNYRWKHPVHEVLTCTGNEVQHWTKLEIHHHPDDTKSRELFFHNKWPEAIQEFKRHLGLPRARWKPERAASMRYLAKMEEHERESWLLKAIAESPGSREARVDLAQHYYSKSLWLDCYATAHAALRITEQPLEYLNESDAWGYLPHDLIAIASHNMNKPSEAIEHGEKAAAFAPWIDRLQENMAFYKKALITKGN